MGSSLSYGAYMASNTLSLDELEGIPLVFAGWLRYLLSIDDKGDPFKPRRLFCWVGNFRKMSSTLI